MTRPVTDPEDLGEWYHRIDLGDGRFTPGIRDQGLVFDLYRQHLPADLTGLDVLDLGANAGGMSVELASRGANVLAVERQEFYLDQARFVVETRGLTDRVRLLQADVYDCVRLNQSFDIVCMLGLLYHLRHPQLALDMCARLCQGLLLVSSQTVEGEGLVLRNRAPSEHELGGLHGWEPSEGLLLEMVASAGFANPRMVSTAPHPGEGGGRICGNRSYAIADSPTWTRPLPFVDAGSTRPASRRSWFEGLRRR